MSDPMISTAENRKVECAKCGTTITETKFIGAFQGGLQWCKQSHSAPCGLPCFGAGVNGKAYRLGQFHRSYSECPKCSPKETP